MGAPGSDNQPDNGAHPIAATDSPNIDAGEASTTGVAPTDSPRSVARTGIYRGWPIAGVAFLSSGLAIGMIAFQQNDLKTSKPNDRLAQKFNYALKSSQIAAFLSGIPEARAKIPLQQPTKRSYKDAIKAAQSATVLILVHQ